MAVQPLLKRQQLDGLSLLVDTAAREAGLMVAFSDRNGGVSAPPFRSLNLSTSVGDDESAVVVNRERLAAAAGFDPALLVLAKQVHGNGLIEVSNGTTGIAGEGDVLVTHEAGPVIGILVADCVPVILAGLASVAAVHAGWRGLVAGAIQKGVEAIHGVQAAWVGPSIRSCCYEVGPEVIDAFRGSGLPVEVDNRVDPAEAAVFSLHRTGVEKVFKSEICTSCNPNYFSHRRDGLTGRQGAFVGRLTQHSSSNP